jgi:hypothetical protein
MLSLIYSEVLKMIKISGFLDFDAEIYCPDSQERILPRGYDKKKSKISDEAHIMTSKNLLVKVSQAYGQLNLSKFLNISLLISFYQMQMLRNLKDAFWPFQYDRSSSLFLRAAHAASRLYESSVGQDPTSTTENVR